MSHTTIISTMLSSQLLLLLLPLVSTAFYLLIPNLPGAASQFLPQDEVEALKDIARTLRKNDWDFNINPCDNGSSWATPNPPRGFDNRVVCNCSLISSPRICHVVNISLKGQDLAGRLPPEIGRLPYLQEIDLSHNYLDGPIPEEWGSTKLVKIGYMAPKYALRGYLTYKVDIYSFGIVALEIVSGRSNFTTRPKEEPLYLLDWAHILKEEGKLIELVDPRLGSEYDEDEAIAMIKVAFLCTDTSLTNRPSMSSVVSMLEGKIPVGELLTNSSASFATDRDKLQMLKNYYQYSSNEHSKNGNVQLQSNSSGGPWTGSSSSACDLYPINVDSEYWNIRN